MIDLETSHGLKSQQFSIMNPNYSIGGEAPPSDPNVKYALTDVGNAQRMADSLQNSVLYCPQLGGWLERANGKYSRISKSKISLHAIKVIRSMCGNPDGKQILSGEYAALCSWQTASESAARISGMTKLAESMLEVDVSIFDSDPLELNLLNGVVNLRDGSFRKHAKRDRFVRVANVEYDMNATCPRWEQFVSTISKDRDGIRLFLQKLSGYFLTGLTSDQAFYNFFGSGANGKSTWLLVLSTLLGDYALTVPADSLMPKSFSGGPTPYLADLNGIRLCYVSEMAENEPLDEARIKSLTGSENVAANAKYKDPIEYKPQFKICVATNHPLNIAGTDDGIWRRLKMIPFEHQFDGETRQVDFHEILLKERQGILNWMIDGCIQYRNSGLALPGWIRKENMALRRKSDHCSEFVETQLNKSPGASELFSDVYQAYRNWTGLNQLSPLSKNRFSREIKRLGITTRRGSQNKVLIENYCRL